MSIFYRAMKHFHKCGYKVVVIQGKYLVRPYTEEELISKGIDINQISELKAILDLKPKMCEGTQGVVKLAQKCGFASIR